MRRKSSVKEGPLYKGYRIYTSCLPSEHWLSKIVKLGEKKAITKDSLTAAVTGIPGEYGSEAEALQAAKRYIDEEDAPRQDEGQENGTPPHGEYRRARGDERPPMKATLSPSWELSTDAAASHEGQPVLVDRTTGEAFGSADLVRLSECKALIPAALAVRRLAPAADLDGQPRALVVQVVGSLLPR